MKRDVGDESEVDIWSGFEVRIAIAVSFESDGEIEAEIKSYFKMGWFKTGRSFQMIILILSYISFLFALCEAPQTAR